MHNNRPNHLILSSVYQVEIVKINVGQIINDFFARKDSRKEQYFN